MIKTTKVLLRNILIDKSMYECLKIKKPEIDLSLYKLNTNSYTVGNLKRIDNLIQYRIKGVSFPPVKLNKENIYLPPHKRINNDNKYTSFYNIVDGRHRVASAILFDNNEIDAFVINK